MRPPSRVFIATLKPLPSSPSRFSFGTRQFSNTSSMVGDERIPIFFSFLPNENPGVPFSTMKAVMPWCFSAFLSVRAKTT